jgi:hypothetical protein
MSETTSAPIFLIPEFIDWNNAEEDINTSGDITIGGEMSSRVVDSETIECNEIILDNGEITDLSLRFNQESNTGIFLDPGNSLNIVYQGGIDQTFTSTHNIFSKTLRYTGSVPVDGYLLRTNADGDLSYLDPSTLTPGVGTDIISLSDGTISSPSLNFMNATDTGLFRSREGQVGLVVEGEAALTIDMPAEQITFPSMEVNASSFSISRETQLPPSELGTILACFDFSGSSVVASCNGNFEAVSRGDVISLSSNFNGRASVAQVGSTSEFVLNNSSDMSFVSSLDTLTISYWIYVDAGGSGSEDVIRITGSGGYLLLSMDGSRNLSLDIFLGANPQANLSNVSSLPGNSWHNLILTFGSGGVSLYISNIDSASPWLSDASTTRPSDLGGITEIKFLSQLIVSNTITAIDNILLISNTLNQTQREDLKNDLYSLNGIVEPQKLNTFEYDTANSRYRIHDTQSGNDIIRWTDTQFEIAQPLRYTGSIPIAGYLLQTDINGDLTYINPSLISSQINNISLSNGNVGSLALSFINETNTGMFIIPDDTLNYVFRGETYQSVKSSRVEFPNQEIASQSFTINTTTSTNPSSLGIIIGCLTFDSSNTMSCNGNFSPDITSNPGFLPLLDGRNTIFVASQSSRLTWNVPSTLDIIRNLPNFAISFWIRPVENTNPTQTRGIFILTGDTARIAISSRGAGSGSPNLINTRIYVTDHLGTVFYDNSDVFGSLNVNTWNHIVLNIGGENGFQMYKDNILIIDRPDITFSINNILNLDLVRFINNDIGSAGQDGEYDDIIFFGNALNASQVNTLYTTNLTFSGVPIVQDITQIDFDGGSTRSRIRDVQSGNDIMTWNATQINISQPLSYTGDTPTMGYFLQTDGMGNLSYQPMPSAAQGILMNGSVSMPAIQFEDDNNLGLFRLAVDNSINFVDDGETILSLTKANVVSAVNLNAPRLTLIDAVNTSSVGNLTVLGCYGFIYGSGGEIISCNGNFQPDFSSLTQEAAFLGRSDVMEGLSDGRMRFTSTLNLNMFQNLTEFTIAFWIIGTGGNTVTWDQVLIRNSDNTSFIKLTRISNQSTLQFQGILNNLTEFNTTIGGVFNNTWRHIVATLGPNGVQLWIDGVSVYTDPSTFAPDDFVVDYVEIRPESGSRRIDNVVISSTQAIQSDVDILYSETFNITGGVTQTDLTEISYDVNNSRSRIKDIPSGNDVIRWTDTQLEIVQPLRYTGSTPTENYILQTNSDGDLTYTNPITIKTKLPSQAVFSSNITTGPVVITGTGYIPITISWVEIRDNSSEFTLSGNDIQYTGAASITFIVRLSLFLRKTSGSDSGNINIRVQSSGSASSEYTIYPLGAGDFSNIFLISTLPLLQNETIQVEVAQSVDDGTKNIAIDVAHIELVES